MRNLKLFLVLITLSSGLSSHADERQMMSGFLKQEETEQYQKFAFRDEGTFLVSQAGFLRRDEALEFCKSIEGFELSDWLLPWVMTISGLPFSELHKNNVIEVEVLDGNHTLSGRNRSGLIFWIQGRKASEEMQLAQGSDSVYAMLNGCGPNCDAVESLAKINAKLVLKGRAVQKPLAICVSQELKSKMSQR